MTDSSTLRKKNSSSEPHELFTHDKIHYTYNWVQIAFKLDDTFKYPLNHKATTIV